MNDLENWVAIVTGSASGIGRSTALMLAKRGARVVINCRTSRAAGEAVVAECSQAGGEAILCQADVADDDACRRLAQAALDSWGRIDALVNNAGTTKFVAHGDLDGLSAEDFQNIYSVNVVGPYQMCRAVVPAMRAQGKGAVVNVSSVAGIMGVGSSIAYAASKGALNTMTLSLARALGPEIRVNTVCPGFVQGSWLREGLGAEVYDGNVRKLEEHAPLRKAGWPDDMAESVVYFLTAGGHVTGEILAVDGGVHLGMAPLIAR